MEIKRFCKNAQLARSANSGFGICSQRACAEKRAGPDRNTACHILTIHPDTARRFEKMAVGTLLASLQRRGLLCKRLQTITSLHCLPSTENMSKQCLDGRNRQPCLKVLTVQNRADIFVSVLEMDHLGNQNCLIRWIGSRS